MEDTDERYVFNKCVPVGPQTIVVRQVVGQRSKQKCIDLHLCVPRRKPAIEQIIDVYAKKICITCVDLIHDKVIVRGHFEVKAIYVACLPGKPVHALEMRRVRFTADVPIYGARCGMDADADVFVEYVDYDCHERRCLYKYRHMYGPYKKKHKDACDDDCDGHHHPHYDDCDDHHHHSHCDDDCDDHHHHYDCCVRDFDVSIVLNVTAKVMTDRTVLLNQYYPGVPAKPKG